MWINIQNTDFGHQNTTFLSDIQNTIFGGTGPWYSFLKHLLSLQGLCRERTLFLATSYSIKGEKSSLLIPFISNNTRKVTNFTNLDQPLDIILGGKIWFSNC